MQPADKFVFGKYKTPKVSLGEMIPCMLRDCDVKVVGLSDSRIQWPLGQRPGKGAKTLIIYGDLEKAIRRESLRAVCYWFGVTPQTVTVWRRALGVPRCNEGTLKILSDNFKTPWAREIQKKAHSRLSDPDRCEKIRLSRLGKKRPQEVIEKIRLGHMGLKLSMEHRRKLSIAQRKRRVIPPAAGKPWTKAELEILYSKSPEDVVRETGRTYSAVFSYRCLLLKKDPSIQFAFPTNAPKRWTRKEIRLLYKFKPKAVSKMTGRSFKATCDKRRMLKIKNPEVTFP